MYSSTSLFKCLTCPQAKKHHSTRPLMLQTIPRTNATTTVSSGGAVSYLMGLKDVTSKDPLSFFRLSESLVPIPTQTTSLDTDHPHTIKSRGMMMMTNSCATVGIPRC